MSELKHGLLVCFGNPLLDIITASNGDELLSKYDLQPNNAILAEEKHKPLYDDLIKNCEVEYIAGGASQNTARIFQKVLRVPNVVVVYTGCVGRDSYSEILEEKAREDGVDCRYQYTTEEPTGTCAVILTNNGKNRSLCANLAAATKFTIDHIEKPENAKIIQEASYYYVTGFFLIVSPDTALKVAEDACAGKKQFIMNLSAPYICHSFQKNLEPLLPYVDILFGNETEAEAFSEVFLKLKSTNLEEIALKIARLPKKNEDKKRLVVITHGDKPVIVANENGVKTVPVSRLPQEKIIDTNGAGDAFVGGFLAQLVQQQPYDVCVKCGSWAAADVIQQSGCIFQTSEKFDPGKIA